jgi:hypothetical protein
MPGYAGSRHRDVTAPQSFSAPTAGVGYAYMRTRMQAVTSGVPNVCEIVAWHASG